MAVAYDTALTSVAEANAYMKGGQNEAVLAALVPAVSQKLSKRCRRKFLDEAAHTEYLNGTGRCDIYVRNWPINSVTSIIVDATYTFAAADALTEQTLGSATTGDFLVDPDGEEAFGRIVRLNGVWPLGRKNIQVVYEGGYEDVPVEVADLAKQLVAYYYQIVNKGMHAGNAGAAGPGGIAREVERESIPDFIDRQLSKWMRGTDLV